LDGCEKKGVAGKGIRIVMKTKGGQILWLQRHKGMNARNVGGRLFANTALFEAQGKGGYHPRGDRKSAQGIGNNRDIELPLRKRVRNRMKLLGLQGYDRKERSCGV
jgi:hypothetical protein